MPNLISVYLMLFANLFPQSASTQKFANYFFKGPDDVEEQQRDEFPHFISSEAPLQPALQSELVAPIQPISDSTVSDVNQPTAPSESNVLVASTTEDISDTAVSGEPEVAEQQSISTSYVPEGSSILDMPVDCKVAPLQPQAPLQPPASDSKDNPKDPLISGGEGVNISFELSQQPEGNY